ncbi:hypothetical protein CYY_007993 [Polysphondylium violaceum]|uniref:Uncharacterized protein n=1 Tax=Polysphondylium violaceum TaxID=133409 RepID=A0A8J4PML9_9MYCE|nr:hypothetical protein CYY_007993 [Polysphondylium violaceum]
MKSIFLFQLTLCILFFLSVSVQSKYLGLYQLGARDTKWELLNETTDPYEKGISYTVNIERSETLQFKYVLDSDTVNRQLFIRFTSDGFEESFIFKTASYTKDITTPNLITFCRGGGAKEIEFTLKCTNSFKGGDIIINTVSNSVSDCK